MFMMILILLIAAGLIFSLIKFVFHIALGAGKLVLSLIFIPIIILLVIGVFKFVLPLLIIGGIAFLVFAIIRGITRSNGSYPQNGTRDQRQDYRQDYQQDYHQNYQQDYRRNDRPDYPQDFIDADYREIK